MSFDLITAITSDGPDQLIMGDNFVGLITILDDFATVAGTSTESKQVKGRRNEPLTSSKYVGYVKISFLDLSFYTVPLLSLEGKRQLTYCSTFINPYPMWLNPTTCRKIKV